MTENYILVEKIDRPPDTDFSDPTRLDDTKLDEQDFDDIKVTLKCFFINPVWTVIKKCLHCPLTEVSCTQ